MNAINAKNKLILFILNKSLNITYYIKRAFTNQSSCFNRSLYSKSKD